MQMKVLLFLCLFPYLYAYPTNVVESLIWSSKSIDFVIACDEADRAEFFKLIYNTITELNKAVGKQYFQWKEVTAKEAISKPRYIIFYLEKFECGECVSVSSGGFHLPFSTSPECNTATNLRNLMVGLGFVYTHLRSDRDQFINIHFDNIYNFDKQVYEKCPDCMESLNEAFAVYDYNSILHFPMLSIYGKNDTLPIISPKHSNIQMAETWKEKTFTPQDVLIFKAIYG